MTRVKSAQGQAAWLGAPGLQIQQDWSLGWPGTSRVIGQGEEGEHSCSLEVAVWAGGSINWAPGTGRKQGTLFSTAAGWGLGVWVADLQLPDCCSSLKGMN